MFDRLETELGAIAPERRCAAIGLERGDCKMRTDDVYCYYHAKVAAGMLDPDEQALYPVFPLPANGYVLVATTMRKAA